MSKRIIHIYPGINCCEVPGERVLVLKMESYSFFLSDDAAEVLIGYLKVVKAYFSSFKKGRQMTTDFYRRVGAVLSKELPGLIQLQHISALIALLGCVTEWNGSYKKN